MMTNNLLSNKQFGFIWGRSTLLQLLHVLDRWTTILDNGGEVDVIFCDFQKAFDKVPHRRLLEVLKHYGFSDPLLSWIRSFLSERTQTVIVNGSKSSVHNIQSGIPQGTVLGPVLFIIYINSLPEAVAESELFMFADDTKVFKEINNTADSEALQQDLNSMWTWSESTLLKFHPDKCKSMTLRRGNEAPTRSYTMNDGAHNLEQVTTEKDIGLLVDSRLQFEEHIQSKVNKANSVMGIIRRTYAFLNKDNFLPLYKALVRPHLEYVNQAWKPHLKKHINILENAQRRATRQVQGLSDLTYEERLRNLNLPTLSYRRLRGDMIETYKILSKKYDPAVCEGLFELSTTTTRGHDLKLSKPRANTNLKKYFFTHRVIDTWNSLPNSVIKAPNTKVFESRLDKHWPYHPSKYCHI